MRAVHELVSAAGPSTASVLIVGESGTGKELVARALHEASNRCSKPFVVLNCAAVPETLIESELFGYEKGAFTGATARKPGCFELADGGTLFLDELSAMPLASQVKLLRILEERSFRRLRGVEEIAVDVRMVAATNEEPGELVDRGRLRADLLFRLNVFTLRLPPLRERVEDIPQLAEHFVERLNAVNNKALRGIDSGAMEALKRHPWPGNVRELRNVIERSLILEDGPVLGIDSLPPRLRRPASSARASDPDADPASRPDGGPGASEGLAGQPVVPIGMTVDEVTRRLILRTLEATDYNRTRAASLLGISIKTIYNKLKRWNITPEDVRGGTAGRDIPMGGAAARSGRTHRTSPEPAT